MKGEQTKGHFTFNFHFTLFFNRFLVYKAEVKVPKGDLP